jgi:hypothetical protein
LDWTTLQGLTKAVLTIKHSAELEPVIIVGSIFPSWLPHLGILALRAIKVDLESDQCLSTVASFLANFGSIQTGNID